MGAGLLRLIVIGALICGGIESTVGSRWSVAVAQPQKSAPPPMRQQFGRAASPPLRQQFNRVAPPPMRQQFNRVAPAPVRPQVNQGTRQPLGQTFDRAVRPPVVATPRNRLPPRPTVPGGSVGALKSPVGPLREVFNPAADPPNDAPPGSPPGAPPIPPPPYRPKSPQYGF